MTKTIAKREESTIAPLPDYLAEFNAPLAVLPAEKVTIPYVGFFSTKAGKAAEIAAWCPGIREGDAFLSRNGTFTKLDPFKFHLLTASRLFVERDDTNEAVAVSETDPGDYSSPLKREINAVILVHVGEEIIPAVCSFRHTKSDAGEAAITAAALCRDPETWAGMGEEYRATLVNPPVGRFTVDVRIQKDVTRGGRAFFKAVGIARPIQPAESKRLAAFLCDPANEPAITAARNAHNRRVEELTGTL